RAPRAPAVLLIVTIRSGERAPSGIPEDARVIDLAGLSSAEGRELVETFSARIAPALAADAEMLVREADGHPLFLHELLMHAAETGISSGVVHLEVVLFDRIQRLQVPARQLLEVLAVGGAPIPFVIAAQAANLEPAETTRVLAILRVALLARTTGFGATAVLEVYHDRIRETLVARLPEQQRTAIHVRLADALEGARPELLDSRALVRHLEAAGEPELASVRRTQAPRAQSSLPPHTL
ncbi:MAG: hypothetical protein ACHQQR_16235, partial [Gemmatimonadales bacterium]